MAKVKHVSVPLKKVMKKVKQKKVDNMETRIYQKENRLAKDAPYISNKTYNKDSREIAEMKKELLKFKIKHNIKD